MFVKIQTYLDSRHHLAMATMTLICIWGYRAFSLGILFFLLLTGLLVHLKTHRIYVVFFISICTLHSIASNIQLDTSQGYCGKVTNISKGRFTLSSNMFNVTVFSDKLVNYDDLICLGEGIKPNKTTENFVQDPWALYAVSQRSLGVYSGKISIIRRSHSLKRHVHQFLVNKKAQWSLSLLLGQPLPVRSFFSDFFLSSGMHISFAFSLIKRILGYFFFSKKAHRIHFLLLIAYGLFWRIDLTLSRLILSSCLSKSTFKSRNLVIYSLLLVSFPTAYRSLAWIIPCIYSIASGYRLSTNTLRWTLFPWIQLAISYQVSFLTWILFPMLKTGSGLLFIGAWLGLLFPPVTYVVEHVATWMSSIQVNQLYLAFRPPFWSIFIICISSLMYAKQLKRLLLIHFVVTLILVGCYWVQPWATITYFNVGQANATLVQLPFRQGTFMIDVGRAKHQAMILRSLRAQGIQNLDTVFISHDDDDHSGGLSSLSESIAIHQVIQEKVDVTIGKLTIHSLLSKYTGVNKNDESLVLAFRLGACTYLFPGDLLASGEQKLIESYPNLRADILLLPHHGSKTSSSFEFISTVQPKLAIVSSDPSIYGHPHIDVRKTLFQTQVPAVLTSEQGDIRLLIFGKYTLLLSSSRQFGIIKCR